MSDKTLHTICGMYCGICDYLSNGCPGCDNVNGKPFWTEFAGVSVCPVYDCCVNEKKLEHCGHCERLMCEKFTQIRDPNMTDEEIEKCNRERLVDLKGRVEIKHHRS